MGRRAHKPDPALRRQVEAMAAYGIPEIDISAVLGLDPKTLRKHYREELDLGETKANAQVAGFLFNSARSGNVTAQIFWLKTRAKWKEPPAELKHATVGAAELSDWSDEQLEGYLARELEHFRASQHPGEAGDTAPPKLMLSDQRQGA